MCLASEPDRQGARNMNDVHSLCLKNESWVAASPGHFVFVLRVYPLREGQPP